MRPRPGLLLLAFLVALPAEASAAGRGERPACWPRETRTVLANELARIYHRDRRVWGGCAYGSDRRFLLGRQGPGKRTAGLALAGHLASVQDIGCRARRSCGTLRVLDLRSGRELRRAELARGERVVEIALKRDGALAWIDETWVAPPPGGAHIERRVMRLDGSEAVVLDQRSAGPGAPGRLALARNTLYWTSGGTARSAPIGGEPDPSWAPVRRDSGRHAPRCRNGGSRTVHAGKLVRVLATGRSRWRGGVFACSLRTGRWTRLYGRGSNSWPRPLGLATAGHLLAHADAYCYHATSCAGQIGVVDVLRRRHRFRMPVAAGSWVHSIVLARDGSGAAIVDRYNRPRQLLAWRPDGTPVVLDEGDGVEGLSLALADSATGATLYWTSAGGPRSAGLG